MGTVARKLSAIFFAVFLSAALLGGVAFFPDGELGTDDDAVTVSYTENGVVATAVQPIGAAPFSWTVSFDGNGGAGRMDSVKVCAGAEYSLPVCDFAPPGGMVFSGWDRGAVGAVITVSGDTALTAQWEELFLGGIGITSPPVKTEYREGETFDGTGMVVTAAYSNGAVAVVSAGVAFFPTGALRLSDSAVTVLYTEGGVTAEAEQPIRVTPSCYPVRFEANGGTGKMESVLIDAGEEYLLPECGFVAPPGKAFCSWDLGSPGDAIAVTEETVLTARWEDAWCDAVYVFQTGAGSEWIKGSASPLEFTVTRSKNGAAAFSRYRGAEVDGAPLGAVSAAFAEGGVCLILPPAYLAGLDTGEHTLALAFDDGVVSARFTVSPAPFSLPGAGEDLLSEGDPPPPPTGGGPGCLFWIGRCAAALASAALLSAVPLFTKEKKPDPAGRTTVSK